MGKSRIPEPRFRLEDTDGDCIELHMSTTQGPTTVCVFTYGKFSYELTGVRLSLDDLTQVRDAMTSILKEHGRS